MTSWHVLRVLPKLAQALLMILVLACNDTQQPQVPGPAALGQAGVAIGQAPVQLPTTGRWRTMAEVAGVNPCAELPPNLACSRCMTGNVPGCLASYKSTLEVSSKAVRNPELGVPAVKPPKYYIETALADTDMVALRALPNFAVLNAQYIGVVPPQ